MRTLSKYIFFINIIIASVFSLNAEELNFGYASGENIVSIINKFTPMMDYLSDKMGMKVNFVRTASYAETQEGFINGVLDIGILNALSFLEMEEKNIIIPIAERLKEGKSSYQSYIVVKKGSPVLNIQDIKGKIFAFGDPNSTSSTLIPQKLLLDTDIDIYKDLKQFIYFQKQDSILYAVLNKTVDAGAVASFIFEESDPEVKNLLKVIEKSNPFPLGPFVVSRRMNNEIKGKLLEILLSMNTTEEGRYALKKADLQGFTLFINKDFDQLREIYKKQQEQIK
ncbi:phosphate/phosphite/phosphonate ABC transporter substrate-binding protein [bacterium]|nr:phosphate/phosphite/phosphonate ABC transporter substrate-binding protein [bacterium]